MPQLLIPNGVISMTGEAADALLRLGSGDGALLYLALLRYGTLDGARGALKWAPARLAEGYQALVSAQLAAPGGAAAPTKTPPEPDAAPDYLVADIAQALECDGTFAGLERAVEQCLGKVLSAADLQTLFMIYDYLALPAEVTLLLTNFCVRETERKYGPGRKPKMSVLKKTAFQWHRMGLDTSEAVEEYLQSQSKLQGREAQLLPLLGISGRPPLDREREYISGWVDMGFSDGAIRMAYEKTVMKKQSLNWAYMNSILKSWHQKGLHSQADILAGDSAPLHREGKTAVAAEKNRQLQQDLDDLYRD